MFCYPCATAPIALLEFQESDSPDALENYIAEFGERSGDYC
ncbi:MAG: hypothetical protein P0S93_02230 [Candidatus Neptunochlamydia sp.]|nr:hypothetical protein [Candidatus Neptunochlamydia sp.]